MNLAVYLAGMLTFVSGFYFVKKSHKVWNGVCSLFLSCMVWMLVQAMAGQVDILLHHKITAWQYGILGMMIGGYWWWKIWKERKKQEYRYEWLDLFMAGLLLALLLGWGRYQFGSHFRDFNYRSVTDSARHLFFARTLVEEGISYVSMFFAAVNTAVWINALEGIVCRFDQYRIYIVFDLVVFLFNGMMFWTAIRRFLCDNYLKTVGVVFTLLWACGHPINSLAYGTIYLSTGILLTLLIYHFSMLMLNKEIERDWGIGLLGFAIISLIYSYVLFIPAFVFGPLIYLYYAGKAERKEVTPKLIRNSWILWGGAFLLGVLYLYFFYVTGDAVLFSDLQLEGLMYGHPYADYLFLFPFLLLLLKADWKKKRIGLEEFLFLLELGFVIILFAGTFYGRISKYYLYKSYVTLWGAAFLSVMKYISGIERERRETVTSLLVTWVLIAALCVTNVENRLFQKSSRYGDNSAAEACFPVYAANLSMPRELDKYRGLNELIMEAARVSCEQRMLIPYLSLCEWNQIPGDNWQAGDFRRRFYSLSAQNPEFQFQSKDWEQLLRDIRGTYQYILLVCESGVAKDSERQLERFGSCEIIRRNPYGCFVRLKE